MDAIEGNTSAEKNLPSPGDLLVDKYRIERLIGRGGMGAVFAAEHTLLHQRVAVKLLLGELVKSEEAAARFLNEARAAAQIQGEHVARVFDVGRLPEGTPYMVLEYLEGADLSKMLKEHGPFAIEDVADYAVQALDALAQAHSAGIVHRDLKPANLFLAKRRDGGAIVKVLDFGISKNLSAFGAAERMTHTRSLLGSPEYMSPEQLRTPREVGTPTDIWSLGVILYELLTGKLPFEAETVTELFVQVLEATPAPVSSLREDVPPALEEVIARCMQRDVKARFATAAELAAALVPFASAPTRALVAARRGTSIPAASEVEDGVAPAMPITPARVTPRRTTPPAVTPAGAALPASFGASAPVVPALGETTLGAAIPPRRDRASVVKLGAPIAIVAVFLLIGGAMLIRKSHSHEVAVQGLVSGADLSTNVPAAMQPAAAASDPASASTSIAEPAPTAKAAPSPAHAARGEAAPRAKASASVPKESPNCNPRYFIDKNGDKRFKPECF